VNSLFLAVVHRIDTLTAWPVVPSYYMKLDRGVALRLELRLMHTVCLGLQRAL
jgi:hypothetical protein